MSEVMVAEKAGMLVGGDKENGFNVIGWVLAGDEYDCDTESGEALVTHHKTAEKLGLGDVFKEMKAENAPKVIFLNPINIIAIVANDEGSTDVICVDQTVFMVKETPMQVFNLINNKVN